MTDEELVEASLDGAEAAFGELVDRHRQRLFRFLLTRVSCRADAEDIIQDTFIAAYRYLSSFDSRWRFSTWLYRIAIRNAIRQRDPGNDAGDAEPVDDADPLSHCIAASERENVWITAKKVLSADAFNALWLRYVEDLSVKEVARALDRSTSWAKVSLMRSRRMLGAELNGAGCAQTGSQSYG